MTDLLDTDLPVHPFTGLTALAVIGSRSVWPVLGGAPDDEDQDEKDAGDEDAPAEDNDTNEDTEGTSGGDSDEDEEDAPLGPKGTKALVAEKARRREETRKRRAAEAELDKLRSGGKADDPDQIRHQAEQAATAKANLRILRSEVRAVATGKLADPKDALTFIDLDSFEVDENGDVDTEEIADAIDTLLTSKPYLAAATAKRFQGTGDGGAARKAAQPKQLTRDDVKRMSPQQIVKAKADGRLDDVLGIDTR
ncbi:DNA polymerase V family protein [Nocardiopsis sp. ARC36]